MLERLKAVLAGRYAIEREVGRGGMATVYLARDLKHGRNVAIKVLSPELAGMLGPERFVREIETAARLQHPHILPLLDSGAEDGLLYYVMPYVEGESLRSRLSSQRQLAQDEAARLAAEVARALDYSHRNGIVHRDIKPENVLLADGEAVVSDFGIARAIRESGGENLTRSGVTLGSPPYMSPEQIAGGIDVDGRSDVYSLGCMLYEMLAGQAPFTGPAETLAHQHLNVAPRPLRDLRPSVSAELEAIVARALSKTPADRFATGSELVAALAAASRTTVPLARDVPTMATPPPVRAKRPKLRVALVAAGVVAIAAIALVLARTRLGQDSSVDGASHRRWVWLADFEGPADDPGLAPAARGLVAASIDESKVLATVPSEQITIALRNSGRADTVAIGPELARELAFRSSIPVVIEGRIGRIGTSYAVTLRAMDAEKGTVIESAIGEAQSERDLVPVLTRLARDLRRALGERPDAFRTSESWPDAATPSFEAFKLFHRGRILHDQSEYWAAIPLARQALAVDPEFASAWALLGTAQGNLGQIDSSMAALQEALRHPDRLSTIRRLDIEGKIASGRGDDQTALEVYDAILHLDPSPGDRAMALNNKAVALSRRGHTEQALALYRESVALDPVEPSALGRGNIANELIALGRLAEAREVLADLSDPFSRMSALDALMAERSWDRAESLSTAVAGDAALPPVIRSFGLGAHGAVLAVRGDLVGARRAMDSPQRRALMGDLPRPIGVNWFMRSFAARLLDEPQPEVPNVIRKTPWGIAALAVRAADDGDSVRARKAVGTWPDSTDLASLDALGNHVEARLGARQGRWDEVVSRLRSNASRGNRDSPTVERVLRLPARWMLADAFEQLAMPDSAVAYLGLILDPPANEPPHAGMRGQWEPFVRTRLVRVYAGMGRIEDAERQWMILSTTMTRPDAQATAMLDETRAVLQSARAMRTSER
ncbi:MAG: protein kinase domain-containing protein [Candidatus Eiseniibacteriota bacterium]